MHGDRQVTVEWKKAMIVYLHKGKGSKDEYNIYNRGISVPEKVYGRVDGEIDGCTYVKGRLSRSREDLGKKNYV